MLSPRLYPGIESIIDTIYIVVCSGKEWNIEWTSNGFCTFVNHSREELMGESFLHHVAARDIEYYGPSLTESTENESVVIRYHRTIMGFTWCWLDEKTETRGVIISKMPLEKMRKGEGLLWKELDVCLDSIYDGIWVIDSKGITLRVNKAMERIGGFAESQVLGRHVTYAIEQGYTKTAVTLKALEAGHAVTMFDYYAEDKQCLNTSTPIFDEHGNIWRVIACVRDLSELESLKKRLTKAEWEAKVYREKLHAIEVRTQEDLVGFSPTMQQINRELEKAAKVRHTVLLLGETGTGKTYAAATIHSKGPRHEGPFISQNCGAIPMELLEAELFGYEKGAFTGAKESGKLGMFDLADKGTLFLDEIGELPLSMQVKLLHVLDGDGYRRIGGTKQIIPDVRVIAATNRNMEELLDAGTFRHDLYYRLRGLVIVIPPLRERPDDIPLLSKHFLEQNNAKHNVKKTFSPRVLDIFRGNSWPGNIRELETTVDLLVAISRESVIDLHDLPSYLKPDDVPLDDYVLPKGKTLKEAVEELESRMIQNALIEGGSSYKAAKILGTSQSTVVRKAQRYKIGIAEVDHEED